MPKMHKRTCEGCDAPFLTSDDRLAYCPVCIFDFQQKVAAEIERRKTARAELTAKQNLDRKTRFLQARKEPTSW